MSEEGTMHFSDVFATPGEWVPVDFVTPAHTASLRREGGGPSTISAEELSLETEEMPPGMASAWQKMGGWPAFGTRIRAVAQVLGGKVELQSFRENGYGAERREVRYVGPRMDDL